MRGNGVLHETNRLYSRHALHLAPEAREVRLTGRHEVDGRYGRLAVAAGMRVNAGPASLKHRGHLRVLPQRPATSPPRGALPAIRAVSAVLPRAVNAAHGRHGAAQGRHPSGHAQSRRHGAEP